MKKEESVAMFLAAVRDVPQQWDVTHFLHEVSSFLKLARMAQDALDGKRVNAMEMIALLQVSEGMLYRVSESLSRFEKGSQELLRAELLRAEKARLEHKLN